jgi:hypothetical protein
MSTFKSSINGRFVKAEYAKQNPNTTYKLGTKKVTSKSNSSKKPR